MHKVSFNYIVFIAIEVYTGNSFPINGRCRILVMVIKNLVIDYVGRDDQLRRKSDHRKVYRI